MLTFFCTHFGKCLNTGSVCSITVQWKKYVAVHLRVVMKKTNIVYIFLPSKRKKKKVTLPKLKLILFTFRILLETFSVVCSFKILLWGNYTIGLV